MDTLTRIRDEIALAGSKPVRIQVTPEVYERLVDDVLRHAELTDRGMAEPLLLIVLDCDVEAEEGPDCLISFHDVPDLVVDLG